MRYAAELVCDTLRRLGVRTLFTMAGSQNLPLFEALRTSGLRAVASTSELAASFAANGYYRASGQIGILATIPGPGFTISLSGIAEAKLDSAAVLMITSSAEGTSTRKFQHQEIDLKGIAGPLVKQVYEVGDVKDLVTTLSRAYQHAGMGEPGPVLVHLQQAIFGDYADPSERLLTPEVKPIDPRSVEGVARLVAQAKRIFMFVGQGGASYSDRVRRLAERLNAPVMTTCSGRGILPENHPLSLVYDYGFGGGTEVNACIESCDLVLALGCKFAHNGCGGFRLRIPQEKLVHVDASEEVVGANYPVRIGVVGDVGAFLDALCAALGPASLSSQWKENEIQSWRFRYRQERGRLMRPLPVIQGREPMSCESFFEAMRRALPADACVVTDSGYHQMLTRQFFNVQSARGLIVPSDFQSMGFGIPAAVGAAISAPHRKVVALVGDGGMAITGLELLTAIREGLNLTVIVFNDGYLGLIRRNQLESSGREHGVALHNPDFEILAGAIGAGYFTLDDAPDAALQKCFNTHGVNIFEVFIKDAPPLRRPRLKRIARNAVRKTIHPSLLNQLKGILRRRG